MLPFAALASPGWRAAARPVASARGARGAAAVVCLAVAVAGVMSVTTRDDRSLVQRADVDAVLGDPATDATVVALNAPEVLALSGRETRSRTRS